MIRSNTEFLYHVLNSDHYRDKKIFIEKSYSTGELIIKERSRVFNAFVIKSGVAKCYLSQDNGTDFLLEFFGAGEVVGEIELLNKGLSFAAVESLTPMEVLEISQDNFHQLLKDDETFNAHVLKLLASKVKYKALRHSYIQSHTLEENVIQVMEKLPELLDTVRKQDLANYLGITQRSLNRVLKGLKDSGKI